MTRDLKLLEECPQIPAVKRLRVLVLFLGPAGRHDGIEEACREQGLDAVLIDVEIDACKHDLTDDYNFGNILRRIKAGEFDAVFMAPPCSSFSVARGARPGEPVEGARRLRGPEGQDLYGFRGLPPDEKEAVRVGTLLA